MKNTKYKETEIGTIPEDWDVKRIGDLVAINERSISKNYLHEDIEYLDTASVENGGLLGVQKLRLAEAPSRARRIVRDDDILISTVRPNLKHFAFIKQAKPNTVASTGFAVITTKKIVPKFLYYYLATDKYTAFLSAIADAHTSTYPSFNPDIIENSNIAFPTSGEQSAIAKILSSLDEKIELNQQMNKTLEAIAQAIFKKWFVDNADPIWRKGKLGDICEKITKGTTPTTLKKNFVKAGINFIKVESIDEFGNFLKDKFAYIDNNTNLLLSRSIIQEDDILYTIAGTIGRTAVANSEVLPANTNQAVAIIRLRNKLLYLSYVRLLLKTPNLREKFQSKVVHAVQPNLSLGEISGTEILMPDEQTLIEFNKMIDSIFLKIGQNAAQISILSQIRDSILPKLMSGRIRVEMDGDDKHGK